MPEVVYVLDAFMKKSKTGIKDPQADKDRVLARFKAAPQDYLAIIDAGEGSDGQDDTGTHDEAGRD